MGVRAVIFDLGGVVTESPFPAIAEFERGQGIAPGHVSELVRSGGSSGAFARLERGELDCTAFAQEFARESAEQGVEMDASTLLPALDAQMTVRAEMVALLKQLRALKLKTAVLTNNWASTAQEARRVHLEPLTDGYVESFRVGMRKPEPASYLRVCQGLGILPSEAVFLDDLGQNLKAARLLGMLTILVHAPKQAISDLTDVLGLPVVGLLS